MATDTNERAESGREILRSRAAQGEPGEKQPAHETARQDAQKTVDELKRLEEDYGAETRPPSASEEVKNHPIPPHERSTARTPMQNAGHQMAAAALGAARSNIEAQLIADARIASDPRHELDQKKFEMGQRGELAFVPPAEEEIAAQAARSGVDKEVLDSIPKTGEEQVARDMPRLEAAERAAAQAKGAQPANPEPDNVRLSQTRTGAGKPAASESPTHTPGVVESGSDTPNAAPAATEASGGGTPIK